MKLPTPFLSAFIGLFSSLAAQTSPPPSSLSLWYEQPAKDAMTEALPIGNGRIGGVVFGGIDAERIQFNEDSLWSGNNSDYGAYQDLGDLYVGFDSGPKLQVSWPSGQHAGDSSKISPVPSIRTS